MPIRLHSNLRKQLKAELAAELAQMRVIHGLVANFRSAPQKMLAFDRSFPRETLQLLKQYIGGWPTVSFLLETLLRELAERTDFSRDSPEMDLTSIPGFKDPEETAERVVSAMESLPWEYAITLGIPGPLAEFLSTHGTSGQIGEHATLVIADHQFRETFPLSSGSARKDELIRWAVASDHSLPRQPELTWASNSMYLQVRGSGFVGSYGSGNTLKDAIDSMKAFFGLGLAFHVFKPNANPLGPVGVQVNLHVFVHRKLGDRWVLETAAPIEPSTARALLGLSAGDLEVRVGAGVAPEQRARGAINHIRSVFESLPRSERILLASQWLFDSLCGSDQLLSFVQAAVVMEILLGDKAASDLVGLGELLGSRCAYLISETATERDDILEEFRRIYQVRSRIVHAGKNRLNDEESKLALTLRSMCERILHKEANLYHQERLRLKREQG